MLGFSKTLCSLRVWLTSLLVGRGKGDEKTRFLNEALGNLTEIYKGMNAQWIEKRYFPVVCTKF